MPDASATVAAPRGDRAGVPAPFPAPGPRLADHAGASTRPRALRKLLSHRGAVVGGIIIALVLVASALAPLVAPADPVKFAVARMPLRETVVAAMAQQQAVAV